jgi:hypothetical protein
MSSIAGLRVLLAIESSIGHDEEFENLARVPAKARGVFHTSARRQFARPKKAIVAHGRFPIYEHRS